jgi:hypothetical protein
MTNSSRGGGARIAGLALVAGLLAVAGCGPSIDPAAKADIDQRVSALKAGEAAFPAPSGFVPMPLAVGQWTQHKMVNDGSPSFMTYKIVGEEGGAYWVETVHESYAGKTIQKMLIAFGNRMDPKQVEIRAVKIKDSKGRVTEQPKEMMPLLQSLYKKAVTSLVLNWQGMPQEDAAVPAGRFAGCYHGRSEGSFGPWSATSDGWSHPSVPISGLVRSQGVDKPFTMELVAFGLTGAQSEL